MKEYLFCVDSDGCAMDTMTIKHVKCFGPDMVKEWELYPWEDEILARWNKINLYTNKRGINRFQSLALILEEINQKYIPIEGVELLRQWVDHTPAFSESHLALELEKQPEAMIFRKALNWSKQVNCDITALSDQEKVAFSGVKESLEKIKGVADLAIVSSANREALEEEWERCGLMEYVDYAMAQDVGTKVACISCMIEKGYSPDKILMIGDAGGDYRAAVKAGVRFYPILAGHEVESWKDLKKGVIDAFVAGEYSRELEAERIEKFHSNLADS